MATSRDYYVESPKQYIGSDGRPSLFLAGGITGCPDWQQDACKMLDGSGLIVINPRCVDFPIDDPSAAEVQIAWEHFHLRVARSILFWFCAEEIQPIALYELGAWSMSSKPIAVGAHPDYPRRQDVVIQTRLVRPSLPVYDSLEATVRGFVQPWEDSPQGGVEVGYDQP